MHWGEGGVVEPSDENIALVSLGQAVVGRGELVLLSRI
jgi:hypothetical protein